MVNDRLGVFTKTASRASSPWRIFDRWGELVYEAKEQPWMLLLHRLGRAGERAAGCPGRLWISTHPGNAPTVCK